MSSESPTAKDANSKLTKKLSFLRYCTYLNLFFLLASCAYTFQHAVINPVNPITQMLGSILILIFLGFAAWLNGLKHAAKAQLNSDNTGS